MKKVRLIKFAVILGLIFSQSIAEAAGCYQAVRKCEGEWTAYNCITDYTSSSCSRYYCESCGLSDDGGINP